MFISESSLTAAIDWDAELSIIVPARNEAATIVELLWRLKYSFPLSEVIVVDNSSTDETAKLAAMVPEVMIVSEPSPGKGNAMRRGAKTATRPVIMFHDADSEYNVADARDVAASVISIPATTRGRFMAIGVRAWKLNWLPVISFLVNGLIRSVFWFRFRDAPEDVLTGTRCLSRDVFLSMDTQAGTFAIETEITRMAIFSQMSILQCPVRYMPRTHREGKKIGWRHLFPILVEAFSCRVAEGQGRAEATATASALPAARELEIQ